MDLQKIIQDSGLRIDFVAAQLFPDNLHPYNALNRVISKDRELNASQLLTLSKITGRPVDELLEPIEKPGFRGLCTAKAVMLKRGEFTVIYEGGADFWQLEKTEKGMYTLVGSFAVARSISVKDFLMEVDTEIKKHI